MNHFLKITLLPLFILFLSLEISIAQDFSIEVEGGGVWFSNNDVRIPNDDGTTFDMLNLIGSDIRPYYRLYALITFSDRHTLRFLYAPLSVSGTGNQPTNTIFESATFSSSSPIKGTYQFSNYRFTYRYTFFKNENWILGAGPALLVRDAKVRLQQNDLDEENTDLGFVPLIHLYA